MDQTNNERIPNIIAAAFLLGIALLGFILGAFIGLDVGEEKAHNFWKNKVRTGQTHDLQRIVEAENQLRAAYLHLDQSNDTLTVIYQNTGLVPKKE